MIKNQNVRLAAVFVLGVIVGFGGYWLWTRNGTGKPETLSDVVQAPKDLIVGDNGLIVKDQASGDTVEVAEVVLQKPGWIAIHENVNGAPGRILGAQLFDSGKHDGMVELLRNTVDGASYFAVIHTDDGNYKNFNPKTDVILNDESGKPVMVKFATDPVQSATTSTSVTVSI